MDNLFDFITKEDVDFTVRFRDRDDLSLRVNCTKEKGYEDCEVEDLYYFSAEALNDSGDVMGRISFNIENEYYVFFGVVKVYDEFASKGVGSKLVEFMEYASQQKGIDNIVGDYDPENDAAQHFYNKRGYRILDIEGTQVVQKNINIEKVNDNLFISEMQNEQELDR